MPDRCIAIGLGYLLDLLLGDPFGKFHPVCLIGSFISFLEKKLRRRGGNLRKSAVVLTALTVLVTAAAVWILLFFAGLFGRIPRLILSTLLVYAGLAARSLSDEAEGVKRALHEGVEAGRKQVERIIGRDTNALSGEEIVKATVETVAENTTDGVISPLFYAALGGPVLLWAFKAASTLDSMVGYMDEKYRDIGWSSARLDDVLNFLPARITGPLLCLSASLTGLDGKNAFRIMKRDHKNHRSPNCAWSESAASGALGIRLSGTHLYFGKPVEKPYIGDETRPATEEDISKTCRMMHVSVLLAVLIILVTGWLIR